jgi:anaerobic selenocysteine-containing dehydrogenase
MTPPGSPVPAALPPVDLDGTRIDQASKAAAGLGAVYKALAISYREMGVLRGTKMLLEINKKDGFDCQSCAWPTPDGDRHVAEFCENGAKAVADEATTKRITRDFFREHSVAELAAKSDHWLGRQGRLTEPMVLRPGASHYEPIGWEEAFELVAPPSTPPAARATRPRSSTSSSSGPLARTTCRTAPTCATSRAARQ